MIDIHSRQILLTPCQATIRRMDHPVFTIAVICDPDIVSPDIHAVDLSEDDPRRGNNHPCFTAVYRTHNRTAQTNGPCLIPADALDALDAFRDRLR